MIDWQKAYDRVSYQYLDRVYRAYGFDQRLIDKLQATMYGFKLQVMTTTANTTTMSGAQQQRHGQQCVYGSVFERKRGVGQGCPMAPLLFSLAINPFASVIKKRLKGIEVFEACAGRLLLPHVTLQQQTAFEGNRFCGQADAECWVDWATGLRKCAAKVSLCADDIIIYCSSKADLCHVYLVLADYMKLSGAKLNLQKSTGVLLGSWKQDDAKAALFKCPVLRKRNDHFKYLGVEMWLDPAPSSNPAGDMTEAERELCVKPWLDKQTRLRNELLFWHRFKLPLLSRAKIVQSMLVNWFTYFAPISAMGDMANVVFYNIQEGLEAFVDQRQCVVESGMYRLPVCFGGLGVPDLRQLVDSHILRFWAVAMRSDEDWAWALRSDMAQYLAQHGFLHPLQPRSMEIRDSSGRLYSEYFKTPLARKREFVPLGYKVVELLRREAGLQTNVTGNRLPAKLWGSFKHDEKLISLIKQRCGVEQMVGLFGADYSHMLLNNNNNNNNTMRRNSSCIITTQQQQLVQQQEQKQKKQHKVVLYEGNRKKCVVLTNEEKVELLRHFVGTYEGYEGERPPVLLFQYNYVVVGRIQDTLVDEFLWTNRASCIKSWQQSSSSGCRSGCRSGCGSRCEDALQIAVLMRDAHKGQEYYYSYGLFELMWSWVLVPSPLAPKPFYECTIKDFSRAGAFCSYVNAPTSIIMYHADWCRVTWYLVKKMPLAKVRSLMYQIGTNSYKLPPYNGELRCPFCKKRGLPVAATLDHIVFECIQSNKLWSTFDKTFGTTVTPASFASIFAAIDRSSPMDSEYNVRQRASSGQQHRTYQTALEAYRGYYYSSSGGGGVTPEHLTRALLEMLHIWLVWTNWWACKDTSRLQRYSSVGTRWRNAVYNCYVLLPENIKRLWQLDPTIRPYLRM